MENDIELLRKFVKNVYLWLGYCYLGQPGTDNEVLWTRIPILSEHEKLGVLAWEEFSKEYPLKKLLEPLKDTDELRAVLKSHGLYGNQLSYKLHLVEFASGKAQNSTGWRKKLIELIDNILGSLEPTGIAGGLKEMKDGLTGSLPD